MSCRAPGRGPLGSSQDRPNSGHQFARRKGFGHVVVGTQLEPEHPVDLTIARGEHDDGDIAAAAELATHIHSIEFACQADVENHELWRAISHLFESALARCCLEHPVAVLAEIHLDQVADVWVIFDKDNSGLVIGHRELIVVWSWPMVAGRLIGLDRPHRSPIGGVCRTWVRRGGM